MKPPKEIWLKGGKVDELDQRYIHELEVEKQIQDAVAKGVAAHLKETNIVWHKWPEEEPHKDGKYLIANLELDKWSAEQIVETQNPNRPTYIRFLRSWSVTHWAEVGELPK